MNQKENEKEERPVATDAPLPDDSTAFQDKLPLKPGNLKLYPIAKAHRSFGELTRPGIADAIDRFCRACFKSGDQEEPLCR
jgi:hypothetical protein